MSNFHPLDAVGRGSEIQVQVCENFNYLFFNSDLGLKVYTYLYR